MKKGEKIVEIPNFFAECLGDQFDCFGCSERNGESLKGKFYVEREGGEKGKGKERVYGCFPAVGKSKTGFPNIVHGGVLSTMIDDLGYWTLFQNYRVLGMTSEMNVKYLAPSSASKEIRGTGKISNPTDTIKPGQVVISEVTLSQQGKPVAKGTVHFFILPPEKIPKIMGKPSLEILNKL